MEKNTTIYDFSANSLRGQEVALKEYAGKVVLIVNTASKCGLTPQYTGLENLYKKYQDKGLVILGFPCNQFGNQEPGDENSISESCLVNYGVTFPMFAKIDVNGPTAHPLYKFLKARQKGLGGSFIKWNFTKFLIDRDGNPVKRYAPTTTPEAIDLELEKILN
jgi:glutathione peroxidase